MKTLLIILFPFILSVSITGILKFQNINPMENLKMQYKITGEGQHLVLVPGGLTGWTSWEPFIPELSASNKVTQVQLLNVQYGLENKNLPENYSVRLESEALLGSLKEIGVTNPVDFIGWSFGAFVLLDFALNNPQLVKSLTLIEPPAFWVLRADGKINEETSNIIKFMGTLTGDITEKQLEDFMTTVGFAQPGTSLREHPQWSNCLRFRFSLRNSGHVAMHEDNLSRLHNFNRPVLLVKGTGSAPFLHEIISILGQEIPNVQNVELQGGHAPHIVSREGFLKTFRKFQENN